MNRITTKTKITQPRPYSPQREVRRNIRAWTALYGIWRGKRITSPVRWQRTIRRQWERKLY